MKDNVCPYCGGVDTLNTPCLTKAINIAVNSNCDYRTIVEWIKEKHNEMS